MVTGQVRLNPQAKMYRGRGCQREWVVSAALVDRCDFAVFPIEDLTSYSNLVSNIKRILSAYGQQHCYQIVISQLTQRLTEM
jgi:hypothetical protein